MSITGLTRVHPGGADKLITAELDYGLKTSTKRKISCIGRLPKTMQLDLCG